MAAGDPVESVDGERRRAVRCRKQIRVDPDGGARSEVRTLVDAVRPDDLLRGGHPSGLAGIGPLDERRRLDRSPELAPPGRDDSTDAANLVLLRREGNRLVRPVLRQVLQPPGARIEDELVAVSRVGHRLAALHDVQAEVDRVAPEDVAHVVAADHDHLEAGFLGDALQSGRTHLAR